MNQKIQFTGDIGVTNVFTRTQWQPQEIKEVGLDVAEELLKDSKFQKYEEEKPQFGRRRRK